MQTLCKSFLMSEEFDGSLGHNLEMKSESVSPGHVQDGQPGLTADNFPPKCLQKKNLFFGILMQVLCIPLTLVTKEFMRSSR